MVVAIEVVRIPALADNYVWLLHDGASGETVVVDPAVAEPVLAAADARGWKIGQIWNTHWHPDHTGGNAGVKAATGATITGPAAEAARIPTLDVKVGAGDRVAIGSIQADILAMPGHTAGHIAFHLPTENMIFVGDVLFAMGCGRLMEGTPGQMFANMRVLADLPDDTAVYCGHEYTVANGRFARTVEPDNTAIADRLAEVEATRARGEPTIPTIPTTIGQERATNPFLRSPDAATLGRLRAAKDSFAS